MQFISTLLEIAIGLICIYIALSLLASWINELIATFLKTRGNNLSDAIAAMLDDATKHAQLFGHPVIATSASGLNRPPSYLSASQFSTALLAIIRTGSDVAKNAADAFSALQDDIAALPAGTLKTALTAFLTQSAGDYNTAVGAIENWYDTTMDRLTGFYRRRTAWIMFIIAIVIASSFNADSVRLYQKLQCSSALRAALVTAATNGTSATDAQANYQAISSKVFDSISFSWWNDDPWITCDASSAKTSNVPAPDNSLAWAYVLAKIAGLLVTAIAISLGAPFWFDTLKLVMNVRNAGPSPNSSTSSSP